MSSNIEASLAAARARPVPWDSARSHRVFSNISAARTRSWHRSIGARLALGSVASAALFLCVARLSSAIHHGSPPPSYSPAASNRSATRSGEEILFEPAIGDGGYEAQEQRPATRRSRRAE